jgi:transcriptional regulator with XRE-family HTH domain
MARNFKELESRMSPGRRERIEAKAREVMAEMLLSEIRKHAGLTQVELADTLGIKQPSLSKLESQDDMQISTLQTIIQAMGGELEILARLPVGTVKITQFESVTAKPRRARRIRTAPAGPRPSTSGSAGGRPSKRR